MAALPEPAHSTTRAIYDWYVAQEDATPRPYLGASEIGEACARRLWLRFRWAGAEAFDGRLLRLFGTGHREEGRVVAELRGIGCQVHDVDPDGKQYRSEFVDGHVAGHMDGAVLGVPEAPKAWHVLEVKTHGAKSFAALLKQGAASKPKHVAQMQMYMGGQGIDRALYFAVNKDTDELYVERVHFDKAEFAKLEQRARDIVYSAEPPPRISNDPSWFECKFCPFHAQCHGEALPNVNCRTCAHSSPVAGGNWQCELHGHKPDVKFQRHGCDDHRFIPSLLERVAELVAVDGNAAKWLNKLTGKTFAQPPYTSEDMRNARDFRVVGDDFVTEYKAVFGAKITRGGDGPTPEERARMAATDDIKDDIPF